VPGFADGSQGGGAQGRRRFLSCGYPDTGIVRMEVESFHFPVSGFGKARRRCIAENANGELPLNSVSLSAAKS